MFVIKSAVPSFLSSRKLLLFIQWKLKMCIYWHYFIIFLKNYINLLKLIQDLLNTIEWWLDEQRILISFNICVYSMVSNQFSRYVEACNLNCQNNVLSVWNYTWNLVMKCACFSWYSHVNSCMIIIYVLNAMQSLPWHIKQTITTQSDFRLTMRCGVGKEGNHFTIYVYDFR